MILARVLLGILTAGAIGAVAGLAPPATTLGVGLALSTALSAATLSEPKALALAWALAVIPLYLNIPGIQYPLPLEMLVGMVLIWRAFVVPGRMPSFGCRTDRLLALILLSGAALSTALSPDVPRAAFHIARFTIWLFYIPLARTWYSTPSAALPGLAMLALALALQALLGFTQLAVGESLTLGMLRSPFAPLFMNANALADRLVKQDFNWIIFGRTFASGLFLNAIVFGLCLTLGGLALLAAPRTWFPRGFAWVWRACGALALMAAIVSLKVTAWLSLLAGGLLLLLMGMKDRQLRLVTTASPIIVATFAALFLRELVTARVLHAISVTAPERVLAWLAYWKSLQYGGLLGTGLGLAQLAPPPFAIYAAGQWVERVLPPENSWIGLAVEMGVPATAALLLLLLRLGVSFRGLTPTWAAPAVAAAVVGVSGVHGLTDEHILPLIALVGGTASGLKARNTR